MMTRRGRVICAALSLLALFLWISSRNSGSRSQSLHKSRVKEPKVREPTHPTWKEPPGEWDPVEDKFLGQQHPDGENINIIQEQREEIAKQGSNLPDEGVRGKSSTRPLQDVQNDENTSRVNGQSEPQKQFSEQGATVGQDAGSENENAEILPEYDPSEGSPIASMNF
jgi:hypothetical protein